MCMYTHAVSIHDMTVTSYLHFGVGGYSQSARQITSYVQCTIASAAISGELNFRDSGEDNVQGNVLRRVSSTLSHHSITPAF